MQILELAKLHINPLLCSGSPKLIPWFVSDVTPPDFKETIEFLLDPKSFLSDIASSQPQPSVEQQQHLRELAGRLRRYVSEGVFELSVPSETSLGGRHTTATPSTKESPLAQFWTAPVAYWDMATYDQELYEFLGNSDLVIFKASRLLCIQIRANHAELSSYLPT